MGLFDVVKNKVGEIRNTVKNNWNIKTKFNPYFDKKETFSLLYKIDEGIDNEIRYIYNQIKKDDPIKYAKEIKRFDDFTHKVRKHNNEIDLINEGIEKFDYQSFIDCPLIHEVSELLIYQKLANKLDKYRYKEECYEKFLRELEDLKNNLKYIKEQYLLKDLYEKKTTFNEDVYYDYQMKDNLMKDLEPLFENMKKSRKRYYDFSRLDKVNDLINQHNEEYISKHISDKLFDDINKKSLDQQQRESILKDEKANLLIAGAGSGKTLTICGKVKFLLEGKKVEPHEILLLSYSKSSSEDLKNKISTIDDRIEVATFHKLGLAILNDVEEKSLVVETQYSAIIEQYFREELKSKPEIMKKTLKYFAMYFSSNNSNKKYKTKGDLYEDLKKNDYSTLKTLFKLSLHPDKKETIKKEYVKSYEEMALANFYFVNGIDYEYERPYEKDVSSREKRQYLPDFYLSGYKIYHEHYGVDKTGKAKQFTDEEEERYLNSIKWKRDLHLQNNTICIETYSYQFEDGTIFNYLVKKLRNYGVKFKPLDDNQIHQALMSIYEGQNFKSFINLVKSFISLYKARYDDNAYFDLLRSKCLTGIYENERRNLFLDIVKDVYDYYIDRVRHLNKIDFDDMILKSVKLIDNTNLFKYKYIIVDEFQDISYSRMVFLKTLIQRGKSKLFAVGDDWQAIYRFSGCDLNIFLNFEDYFGYSSKSFISFTYRNSQELQNVAGKFIKQNKNQINKTITSGKSLKNPIRIMFYDSSKKRAMFDVLNEIKAIDSKANILILGRNNADINDYFPSHCLKHNCSKIKNGIKIVLKGFQEFNINFCTVHSSKGIEEDFVIIINADDSRLGFPNKVEDDELLNLVLSQKSDFEFAEERRLWYVALTRTKSYTYIISSEKNPSIFVEEIKNDCQILNSHSEANNEDVLHCPYCKKGQLLIKSDENKRMKFYYCNNYPYCRYIINDEIAVKRNKRCKKCGDFLLYRKGSHGSFYGCHSYPECTYTEEYNK